tara:strand:- start:2306 stop:3130 length:825 start_codon:yes stop_codon:yes gene_type:complete
MIKKISIYLFCIILLYSCSSNNVDKKEEKASFSSTPETLYISAMTNFNDKNYQKALDLFAEIEKTYPLSNEAVQSQIMSGFIDYLSLEYESAIFKFNRIIQKYPSHENIDYVFYMRAICYFEQISHEELDNNVNLQSLDNFQQIINRFPKSEYAKDAKLKIVLVKENIAAKHMDIGRFYMENDKFIAAMNRFKKVIENHSESKFTPEALFRLVEIYYKIGMNEDAIKTASVIGYNYPDSKWYKYSYDLVTEKEDESILKKIKRVIIKNENGKKS